MEQLDKKMIKQRHLRKDYLTVVHSYETVSVYNCL